MNSPPETQKKAVLEDVRITFHFIARAEKTQQPKLPRNGFLEKESFSKEAFLPKQQEHPINLPSLKLLAGLMTAACKPWLFVRIQ
ncbi:hypothetical protein CDAR_254901 [Caerostris darwini]|uniref:Uncharacterized protein n=1 Tax=Caerostris darwini TaxID=1538125 RepID=A0AAV4VBN7_9ARAC|nr:hypothetical protein CDAR_254901 [Caerostris darwini]